MKSYCLRASILIQSRANRQFTKNSKMHNIRSTLKMLLFPTVPSYLPVLSLLTSMPCIGLSLTKIDQTVPLMKSNLKM